MIADAEDPPPATPSSVPRRSKRKTTYRPLSRQHPSTSKGKARATVIFSSEEGAPALSAPTPAPAPAPPPVPFTMGRMQPSNPALDTYLDQGFSKDEARAFITAKRASFVCLTHTARSLVLVDPEADLIPSIETLDSNPSVRKRKFAPSFLFNTPPPRSPAPHLVGNNPAHEEGLGANVSINDDMEIDAAADAVLAAAPVPENPVGEVEIDELASPSSPQRPTKKVKHQPPRRAKSNSKYAARTPVLKIKRRALSKTAEFVSPVPDGAALVAPSPSLPRIPPIRLRPRAPAVGAHAAPGPAHPSALSVDDLPVLPSSSLHVSFFFYFILFLFFSFVTS